MFSRGNAPLKRAISVKQAKSIYRDPKKSGRRKSKQYNPCETCGKMIKSRPCKFCAVAATETLPQG